MSEIRLARTVLNLSNDEIKILKKSVLNAAIVGEYHNFKNTLWRQSLLSDFEGKSARVRQALALFSKLSSDKFDQSVVGALQ